MPSRTPRRVSLVHVYKTRKIKVYPEFYKQELSAVPQWMTTIISFTTHICKERFRLATCPGDIRSKLSRLESSEAAPYLFPERAKS